MRDGFLYYFLTIVARRLPMLILVFGGIVFAAVRWKLHPRASLITLVALVIYLVDMVVYSSILYWVVPKVMSSMGLSSYATRWLYSLFYFFADFVSAAIILLLVAAAFTGRKPAAETTVEGNV